MGSTRLTFSANWNNKLLCRSFTTIRLIRDVPFKKGQIVDIYRDQYFKGKAKIIDLKCIEFSKINDWMAWIDAGVSLKDFVILFKSFYKNQPQIDWETQKVYYMLLAWEGQERMLFSPETKS